MVAAIYARKSTEQNGVADEQKSVARQLDHARQYAVRKGWTVADAQELLRDPAEISAAVTRIHDDLQSQYLVAFESASADGKYHGITVRTKNPQLRVRARGGYVAPPTSAK